MPWGTLFLAVDEQDNFWLSYIQTDSGGKGNIPGGDHFRAKKVYMNEVRKI